MNPMFKAMLPMILPMIKKIDFSSIFSDLVKENGKIEIFQLDSKIVFTTEKEKQAKDLNEFLQEHLSKL